MSPFCRCVNSSLAGHTPHSLPRAQAEATPPRMPLPRLRHIECYVLDHFRLHLEMENETSPWYYTSLGTMRSAFCAGEQRATMGMAPNLPEDAVRATPILTNLQCDTIALLLCGISYTQTPEYKRTGSGHHGHYYEVLLGIRQQSCALAEAGSAN